DEKGWEVLNKYTYNTSDLAVPRVFEIASAINRIRTLAIQKAKSV
ncbi:MAG: hypothetical protein ACE5FU_00610, partial [Nitrospinota bacterium]